MPDHTDAENGSTAEVRLSLVVSTRNEAHNIDDLLANTAGVDEVVIGDMESTDGTVEIARRAGARVVELPNAGWAEPGRMTTIRAASGDWILVLDADERLAPGGVDAIRRLCRSTPPAVVAYRIPRVNFIGDRPIRGSGWDPELERHARLFRSGRVEWPPHLHSHPEFDGRVIDLPDDGAIRIDHANFRDLSHLLDKLNDYSTIEARSVVDQGGHIVSPLALRFALEEFAARYDPDADETLSLALSVAMFATRFHVGAKTMEMTRWTDDIVIARSSMLAAISNMWATLRKLELARLSAAAEDGDERAHAELERGLVVWGPQPNLLSNSTADVTTDEVVGPWIEVEADEVAAAARIARADLSTRIALREEVRRRQAAEALVEERRRTAEEAVAALDSSARALDEALRRNQDLIDGLAAAQSEVERLRAEVAERTVTTERVSSVRGSAGNLARVLVRRVLPR